jgi:hypothetical protein
MSAEESRVGTGREQPVDVAPCGGNSLTLKSPETRKIHSQKSGYFAAACGFIGRTVDVSVGVPESPPLCANSPSGERRARSPGLRKSADRPTGFGSVLGPSCDHWHGYADTQQKSPCLLYFLCRYRGGRRDASAKEIRQPFDMRFETVSRCRTWNSLRISAQITRQTDL